MFVAVQRRVWRSGHGQGWALFAVTLFIVIAWPPTDGKSLALQFTNWAVDPKGHLPVLPEQLGLGTGDNPDAVEARDAQVRLYDQLYAQGGWIRTRLKLKVAADPFNPATARQTLLAMGVVAAFLAWRTRESWSRTIG